MKDTSLYLRVKTVQTSCRFPGLNQSNDPQIHKNVMDSPKIWRIQPAKKKPRTTNMVFPQVFPTFFLKVNGLPGRHAPAAHFKRPGQGGVSPIFFAELFFFKFQQQKMQDIKRNSEL